jgi:hypothetical protein
LHLLWLVEQRIEQDHVRPGQGNGAQASGVVVGCADDRAGGEVGHPEVAVPALEGILDTIPHAFSVVVDGDVDTFGNGEAAGSRR